MEAGNKDVKRNDSKNYDDNIRKRTELIIKAVDKAQEKKGGYAMASSIYKIKRRRRISSITDRISLPRRR